MIDRQDAPTPMMKGIFSLYETPQGGFKLVYRVEGEDADRPHIDIPPAMVKVAKTMGDGRGRLGVLLGASQKRN